MACLGHPIVRLHSLPRPVANSQCWRPKLSGGAPPLRSRWRMDLSPSTSVASSAAVACAGTTTSSSSSTSFSPRCTGHSRMPMARSQQARWSSVITAASALVACAAGRRWRARPSMLMARHDARTRSSLGMRGSGFSSSPSETRSSVASAREPVRPGKVSAVLPVAPEIERPAYMLPGVCVDQETGMYKHDFLNVIEVKTPDQIAAMRVACALAREALEVAGRAVAAGVTTDQIDAAVHEFIVSRGAYPSPLGYMGFPKSVCCSVNDVLAHGIPDDRPLQDGDILNVDVTVFIGGHHGDTSSMFVVGSKPDPAALHLCKAGQRAMMAGIEVCKPGADFREIGMRIQDVSDAAGLHISELFVGHGIGSYFHGAPGVIPFENDEYQGTMLPGMTFTVEPILVEHTKLEASHRIWDDKWTYQTLTNARSAQFEHTVLITDDGHEILTGPSVDYLTLAGLRR
ncbi:unnamed protein product [Polarella glacialis]|uniref:Methionine aminopeptidase n=1 Tax=Polarella glacialis TaxID=89957 RepID=A0A813G2Y5_POLGL|nr:unnamed protein product [Polarella glacialis]